MKIKKEKSMPSYDKCKITIVGLGYVGLPLAIEFAKTKICKRTGKNIERKIFGIDINESRIQELKNGFDSTLELNMKEMKFLNKIKFPVIFRLPVPRTSDHISQRNWATSPGEFGPNFQRKSDNTTETAPRGDPCGVFRVTLAEF